MRKMLLPLTAAGAALVAASPAAAQYYPQPQPAPGYGYGNAYGNGYGEGFRGNWGEVQALHAQINRIEQQIDQLDRYDRVGDRRADGLRREAQRLEQRLRWKARDGLNPYEAQDMRMRIERLEQQVRYSAAYSRGWDRDDHRWDGDRRDHDRD